MTRELTTKQAAFVAAFIGGMSMTKAAIEAGYTPATARTRGHELLKENPKVIAAVEAHRAKLREKADFTAERAMQKLEDGLTFALKTNNATAFMRGVELQAKLAGLLDGKDKGADAGGGFQITINGLSGPSQQPAPRDVTPKPAAPSGAVEWIALQDQDKKAGSQSKEDAPGIFG